MSDDPHRHGTFDDVIRHLPRIRDMGFDVLYFTPIYPIGHTNRKGRNNALRAAPDDPGSPYATGSEEGGHDALHPELGTFDDFQRLREAAAEHGLELALDFREPASRERSVPVFGLSKTSSVFFSRRICWYEPRSSGKTKFS